MCWPECLHHRGPGCCFFHQAVIHPSPSLCAIVVVRTLSFILTFYYSRPGPVFRACNPSHFSLNALSRGRLLLSRSCIVCRMCNADVLFQKPHVVFYLLLQLFRIMHPTRQVLIWGHCPEENFSKQQLRFYLLHCFSYSKIFDATGMNCHEMTSVQQ